MSELEEKPCYILESRRTNSVLRDFGHLLQRAALLPDWSSHLAQGLFSSSQHITAANHQCPCSSLCLGVCLDLAKWSCPCSSGIARGCSSCCCCESHPKYFIAHAPKPSEMRMFPISGISMTTKNMSILSTNQEYFHSVHHSSEKHICTA